MNFWAKAKVWQGAVGVSEIQNMVEESSRNNFRTSASRQGSTDI